MKNRIIYELFVKEIMILRNLSLIIRLIILILIHQIRGMSHHFLLHLVLLQLILRRIKNYLYITALVQLILILMHHNNINLNTIKRIDIIMILKINNIINNSNILFIRKLPLLPLRYLFPVTTILLLPLKLQIQDTNLH